MLGFTCLDLVFISFSECQDLTEQMIVNGISPIPYSLTVKNMNTKQIKKQIDKVLRNARMLEQKIVVICSPDEEKQNLIEAVLFEVSTTELY